MSPPSISPLRFRVEPPQPQWLQWLHHLNGSTALHHLNGSTALHNLNGSNGSTAARCRAPPSSKARRGSARGKGRGEAVTSGAGAGAARAPGGAWARA